MLLRVFVVTASLLIAVPAPDAMGSSDRAPFRVPTSANTTPPDDTINEFLPEERGLGECISAVPKPGCGSKARGGWRQGLVLLAIVAGLGVIVWRVVASSRRARREQDVALSDRRTPAATTAPADHRGDPEP